MQCTTIKNGNECSFMRKSGCGYTGGACHVIIEQCDGCNRNEEFSGQKYCNVFPEPQTKWRLGNCTMASHIKVAEVKGKGETSKSRVGQQKQKKK